jgi:hypothetical protein
VVSQFPAQIKLLSVHDFVKLSLNPLVLIFSPKDPKDVGVHEIQIFLTETNSPSVVNKFKLSIIGNKKPIETIKIKKNTTII